jgi:hypothetical protein
LEIWADVGEKSVKMGFKEVGCETVDSIEMVDNNLYPMLKPL